MVKATIKSILSNQDSREIHIRIESEYGNRGLNLSFVPYTGDIVAALRRKKCPFSFQLTLSILNAAGIQIEELRIERVEENVIRGLLTIRNGDVVHQVVARPSDAVILMACLEGKPIYVEDALLTEKE